MAQLETINLAQLVTIKKAKLGPVNNFTAYIYIYVVLLSGPSLAFWGVIIWAKYAFTKHCCPLSKKL